MLDCIISPQWYSNLYEIFFMISQEKRKDVGEERMLILEDAGIEELTSSVHKLLKTYLKTVS